MILVRPSILESRHSSPRSFLVYLYVLYKPVRVKHFSRKASKSGKLDLTWLARGSSMYLFGRDEMVGLKGSS